MLGEFHCSEHNPLLTWVHKGTKMVKTRHSGDIDVESPPKFLSLSNEKNRQSTRSGDALVGGDDRNVSKTYREDRDAYNIFNEKVVESRLRPRIGPRRAYNYLDVESSDEDSLRRQTHHSKDFSSRQQMSSFTRSNRIKHEIGTKHRNKPRDRSRRTSSHEDQEQSIPEDGDDNSAKTRTKKSQSCELISDKITGSRTARRGSPTQKHQHSDSDEDDDEEEEEEDDDEIDEGRRPRNSRRQHDASEDEGDETDTLIRRSSRTRRQVYDTLNQSYLVRRPGQKACASEEGDQSDNKDQEDSEDNKVFSDMYSRVKRKRVQVKRNMYGVPINSDSDSEHDKHSRNKNNNKIEDDEDSQGNSDDNFVGDDIENQADSKRVTRRKMKKKEPTVVKSYSLREHKPRTNLYKAPVEERRIRRIHSIFAVTPTKKGANQTYHSPAQRRNIRKRSAFHSSSGSTSSSASESSDEKNFKHRKAKSMAKARSRMMPMNFSSNALPPSNIIKDRVKSGASLADVEPMNIDRNVTFSSIGGLGKHIRALKEMVVFPLLYDKVFQRFKVDPPRGVLFYGPPGTGKTLVARALANECSHGDRRVAFFMRKGADCLSKWVGESERQLRLLFDQAYKFRPSIIFFDEIDGLAPVRSSRQDQIHSSIVSTLLALMDGLDSRGEIVVIGATNRIDSLDPALRRPGRFDREFLFSLPSLEARKQILNIHTASWTPKLNEQFISELAEKCVGYCGADLKALVTEAAMLALRRRYPQIYFTNEALQLDVTSINVSARDFFDAVNNIIPTSQRSANSPARALPPRVYHLLHRQFNIALKQLSDTFPPCLAQSSTSDMAATSSQVQILAENGIIWDELASDEDEDTPSIFVTPSNKGKALRRNSDQGSSKSPTYLKFSSSSRPSTFRPRLMIVGHEGQGQTTYIAPAIIHKMENLPVHVLDLPALYAITAKTPEESCANVFHEAKRKCPSIIYLPYINQWWDVMAETLRATLLTLIHDLNPSLPLLLLATSEQPYAMLDPVLQSLFSRLAGEVMEMKDPNSDERRTFFKDLLLDYTRKPPPQKKQAGEILTLLNESLKSNSFSLNLANSNQRGRVDKRKATTLLPNNISSLKSTGSVNKRQRNKRCKYEADNSFEINMLDTMSDFKVKIPESPVKMTNCVKSIHGMTLRSKNANLCQLNSNQSARECEPFDGCFVLKSKEPALASTFHKEPLHPHNKTVQDEVSSARSWHGCNHSAFNNLDDTNVSNLMNFGTKKAGASTNDTPSSSKQYIRNFNHSKNYDNLRWQMQNIDSTELNTQQAEDYLQPHSSSKHFCHFASVTYQKEPLSCGSFQMQYKNEDRKHCDRYKTRSEVLPLNFRDLNCSHVTKRNKGFKKRLHVKLPKNAPQIHLYNLRLNKQSRNAQRILEVLPKAAPPKPRELTQQELDQLVEKEELTLMELRIFLRDVLNKLGSDKKFSIFAKPVNREEAPDYYEIIENPMDLSTMMAKIDLHEYGTVRAFMNDIDFICSNALEYNPNRGPMDRVIRHRACALKDTAYAIIKTELDKDFEKMCVEIEESRKRRGEKSTTVPNFYCTKPNTEQQSSRSQTVTPRCMENLKQTRTIPKPEGERFSRRVRGLNIDPVPPLEAVEKVFKMSRVTASPHCEDNKNNSNEDSSILLINESDRKILEIESRSSTSGTNISTREERLVNNGPKTTTGNKLQSPALSASKSKKRKQCVWCKPKRKRMRFTSKSLTSNEVADERQEYDVNAEDSGEETSLKATQETDVHQQLRIEIAEQESESKEQKSPARSSTRLKSPVTSSTVRVSTRRSSMSPCNTINVDFNTSNQSQDKYIETTKDNNNQTQQLSIPVDREEKSDSTMNENPLGTNYQTEAIKQPVSINLHTTEPSDKPSVVKRLDLDLVAMDSGVGSSVDSNGDSRDSTDHNREGTNSLKSSSAISTINDLNQNSNSEMTSRASAILDKPIKEMIIDVNRLTSLLNRLVARTDGYNVDRLEKIYSHLNQVIYRHRQNYNRTGMILELEKKVEELTKIVSQSSSNVHQ